MRATGREERSQPGDDWVIRAHAGFLDAEVNPVPRRLRDMILTLEGFCRDRCFCWAGNDTLARKFRCGPRNVQLILRELESAGLIRRVTVGTRRLGIVLLGGRSDPGRPIADTPEALDEAIRTLAAFRAPGRPAAIPSAPQAQGNAPPATQGNAPESGLILEQDEVTLNVEARAPGTGGENPGATTIAAAEAVVDPTSVATDPSTPPTEAQVAS
jgi:hypothetical protein